MNVDSISVNSNKKLYSVQLLDKDKVHGHLSIHVTYIFKINVYKKHSIAMNLLTEFYKHDRYDHKEFDKLLLKIEHSDLEKLCSLTLPCLRVVERGGAKLHF